MISELKKEWRYCTRNYKALIIVIFFIFFALLTPVMLNYVLPTLLRSQIPGLSDEDLHAFLDLSQFGSITNFLSDLTETGTLVIAFTFCGLMAQDIKDNTLVMPLCSGKRFSTIIGAKFMIASLILISATIVGILMTYLYAGVIFAFDVSFVSILKTILLQSIYMLFVVALIIFIGSLFKKAIPTGLLVVFILFGILYLGVLLDITAYLPSGLLTEANQLTKSFSKESVLPLLISLTSTFLLLLGSHFVLTKNEWNTR